jgi:pantetheine-phosphate adenylyltransferase
MSMTKVCLGGTFNVLHEGHEALIGRACQEGDEIFIGLTSDAMASGSRNVKVNPYATRMRHLAEAVERICPEKDFDIREINDAMGPAATGDYDVIVVSNETVPGAERINRARVLAGLKPLKISVVEMVRDSNGQKVSATNIVSK